MTTTDVLSRTASDARRDALPGTPGVARRIGRWLRRIDRDPRIAARIDWHGRFATARAANDLRRATAICRAALGHHDTIGWWLRLARCQAERGFFVDALDAIESALERVGPTGEVRDEAQRLLAATERCADAGSGAAAARLRWAAHHLRRRLAD